MEWVTVLLVVLALPVLVTIIGVTVLSVLLLIGSWVGARADAERARLVTCVACGAVGEWTKRGYTGHRVCDACALHVGRSRGIERIE